MKDAVLATKIVVVYHVEWVLGTLQPLELCSVSVCGRLALCTLHTLEGTQVFTRLSKWEDKYHRKSAQTVLDREENPEPANWGWMNPGQFLLKTLSLRVWGAVVRLGHLFHSLSLQDSGKPGRLPGTSTSLSASWWALLKFLRASFVCINWYDLQKTSDTTE